MMWRSATPQDDSMITAMCRELNREDPGVRPVPDAHMERTLPRLRAEPTRGRALVLELEGRAVGYALLISFWSNEMGGEVLWIDEIFVAREVRGRGHGTALIRDLLEKRGDYVAMELEVTPSNKRARALYESLGFSPAKNANMRIRF